MNKVEYRFIPHGEVAEGILVWRYNKHANISGPYVIIDRSVVRGECFWHLLNTKSGQVFECPQRELRKAVVCN